MAAHQLAGLLLVIGTALLTIGTAAQALSNLLDFGKCAGAATQQVLDAAEKGIANLLKHWRRTILLSLIPGIQVVFVAVYAAALRRNIAELRNKNENDAAQIEAFLWAALIWCVIMFGSALTLAATITQLDLTWASH